MSGLVISPADQGGGNLIPPADTPRDRPIRQTRDAVIAVLPNSVPADCGRRDEPTVREWREPGPYRPAPTRKKGGSLRNRPSVRHPIAIRSRCDTARCR